MGSVALVLYANLPFVRYPEQRHPEPRRQRQSGSDRRISQTFQSLSYGERFLALLGMTPLFVFP